MSGRESRALARDVCGRERNSDKGSVVFLFVSYGRCGAYRLAIGVVVILLICIICIIFIVIVGFVVSFCYICNIM